MPFSLIQFNKDAERKQIWSVVPSQWVEEGIIYLPKISKFTKLARNPHSKPNKSTWTARAGRVITTVSTYDEAEELLKATERDGQGEHVEKLMDAQGPSANTPAKLNVENLESIEDTNSNSRAPDAKSDSWQSSQWNPQYCTDDIIQQPNSDRQISEPDLLEGFSPMGTPISVHSNQSEMFTLCSAVEVITARLNELDAKFNEQMQMMRGIDDKLNIQQALMERLLNQMEAQQQSQHLLNLQQLAVNNRLRYNPGTSRNELRKFHNLQELKQFDAYVKEDNANAFINFIQLLSINAQRDGTSFFAELMQKLLAEDFVMPFTYEGPGGFREQFPNFVHFVWLLTTLVDYNYTMERNDENFSLYVNKKFAEQLPMARADVDTLMSVRKIEVESSSDEVEWS